MRQRSLIRPLLITFSHALRTAIFDQILIILFLSSFIFLLSFRPVAMRYLHSDAVSRFGFPWASLAAVRAAPIWRFAAVAHLALASISQLPGKLALA